MLSECSIRKGVHFQTRNHHVLIIRLAEIKKIDNQQCWWGLPWWPSGWESACQCGGHGFGPWSGRILHAAEQLGLWAITAEPVLWSSRATTTGSPGYWGPRVWSPCSAAMGAATVRGPRTAAGSGPRSLQLERVCVQRRRPSSAKNKINKINKFIKKNNVGESVGNRSSFTFGEC